MERDQIADDCNFPAVNFNSHAHVERDECDATPYCPNYDFNSHAHVERDSFDIRQIVNFKISTHTLTWSVTSSTDL